MSVSNHPPLALLALLLIFPLSMGLFGSMKPAKAATFLVFITALFGPELAFYKLPSFPALDKRVLPYLFMTMAAIGFASNRFFRRAPGLGPELILFMGLFAAIMTGRTNTEPLVYGTSWVIVIPGLNLKDSIAAGLTNILMCAMPFMLGRVLFESRDDLRSFVRVFLLVMFAHVPFILYEIKMSPQLNLMVYGYRAHTDFAQTLRWGGFRPMTFMLHGLALSMVVLHACILLAAVKRAGLQLFKFMKTGHLLLGMLVVLVLCKSTGAIFYGLVAVLIILYMPLRFATRFAQLLVIIVIAYPALRANDLVPVEGLLEWVRSINTDRAASLQFRFEQEFILLEKAQQKYWFGWGGYGRRSVYSEFNGRRISVADGYWIILLGAQGLVGLLMTLGVPVYAALFAGKRIPKIPNEEDRWLMVGILYMVAFALLDLIPNGLFDNYPYFVAGLLFGLASYMTSSKALRAARTGGGYTEDLGPRRKKKRRRGPAPPGAPGSPGSAWRPGPAAPSVNEQDRLFESAPPPPSAGTYHDEDALFDDSAPTQAIDGSELHTLRPGSDPSKKE